MGVALGLQILGGRQIDVIPGDDFGLHLTVGCQVLLEVAAQLFVHFVGRRLYGLEAEATGQPAVKEGAGEGTNARACIQQAAGLQGAGREHARHEACHARRGHELTQLGLVLLSGAWGHLAAHAVCGVKLREHSVSSSLARRTMTPTCL